MIRQAPGLKVQTSGIPWDDQSGKRLRDWLGIDEAIFYDPKRVALVPMGFCYPGKGSSGDLPPRPECAPKWHPLLLKHFKEVELILLIGQYAMERYLGSQNKETLTETVKQFKRVGRLYVPLVHPSPRNQIWLKKNPWFGKEVLPYLKKRIINIAW